MTNAPVPKQGETAINLPADANKDAKKDEAGKSAPGSSDQK